jgi:acetyl esterase/lipase
MIDHNVVYCTMDGVQLEMDVYYPAKAESAWAAVLYVHGGGWTTGDKTRGSGIEEIPALVEAGFLTVAVNYRMAPEYTFPAMIEDVRCAVRYLRAHANKYNLDPQRIGAFGTSAGGHMVALMGTAGDETAWDVGEYLEQSSRVQAVVDYFGPTDLTEPSFNAGMDLAKLKTFGARDRSDPVLAAASPVTYVTPDDPPFLIVHGDKDAAIPLIQSEILYELLQQANVTSELVIVHNAGHGLAPAGERPMSPTRAGVTQMMVAFLLEVLLR